MRKNLLATVSNPDPQPTEGGARSDYARRGASRSMMMSIDEMAENAKKVIAGETIVSLNPDLIDPSFLRDRVEESELDFESFREGIRERGQLQPILVRPHPETAGRYMIVFGHRRTRAAKELGLPVRAVVKELEEINHIIAQGQENSRRADLSFIERSLMARKLLEMSQSKDTIKAALTVDDTILSRMLAVVEIIPAAVIDAIGSARGVGRDRWETLKKLLANPKKAELALEVVGTEEFSAVETPARFQYILNRVSTSVRKPRKNEPLVSSVRDDAGTSLAELRASKHDVLLKLSQPSGVAFGRFLERRLPALFVEFTQVNNQE